MQKERHRAVDKGAVKALVAIYGPREAARIAGIKAGTVMGWCFRYKWKKIVAPKIGPGVKEDSKIDGMDAADVLRQSLENSKRASTLNLAKYTEKASQKAAEHANPLEVARKVRDVAGVYSTLWPVESEQGLIEGGILIGEAQVLDDPKEIKELTDVREIVPDA